MSAQVEAGRRGVRNPGRKPAAGPAGVFLRHRPAQTQIANDGGAIEVVDLRMSEKEKQKLIKAVRPFFNEINAYLDSFKDGPLSEEAMSMGNLAELVSELGLIVLLPQRCGCVRPDRTKRNFHVPRR